MPNGQKSLCGRVAIVILGWICWSNLAFSLPFGLPLRPVRRNVAMFAEKKESRTYQIGDEVLTYYEEDCMWYPGRILSIDRDKGYLVKWDVPEDGLEEIRVQAEHLRMALIPVHDLQIGQKFTGIVYELNQFGAFVDIGAEEHGLLPIRQMAKNWFDSPEDVLDEGQTVEVWVSQREAAIEEMKSQWLSWFQ